MKNNDELQKKPCASRFLLLLVKNNPESLTINNNNETRKMIMTYKHTQTDPQTERARERENMMWINHVKSDKFTVAVVAAASVVVLVVLRIVVVAMVMKMMCIFSRSHNNFPCNYENTRIRLTNERIDIQFSHQQLDSQVDSNRTHASTYATYILSV